MTAGSRQCLLGGYKIASMRLGSLFGEPTVRPAAPTTPPATVKPPAPAARAGRCEVSTVDMAFLLAGALFARSYFDGDDATEREIRAIATKLYGDVDWNWARNGGQTLAMGWTPEPQPFPWGLLNRLLGRDPGFIPWRWQGYNEGMLLAQQVYAAQNPKHFKGYGPLDWGITASLGPLRAGLTRAGFQGGWLGG